MLIVSPSTAHALAPHVGSRSFVMFVQVNPPGAALGPILIEAVKGAHLPAKLWALVDHNAFEPMLIGLLEAPHPEPLAHEIRERFEPERLHGNWFEPVPELLTFVRLNAQGMLQELLIQTQPGALTDQPVDIDVMANMLGVSVKTIRRLVERKEIPFLRLGRALRFVPKDVIASLQQRQR